MTDSRVELGEIAKAINSLTSLNIEREVAEIHREMHDQAQAMHAIASALESIATAIGNGS